MRLLQKLLVLVSLFSTTTIVSAEPLWREGEFRGPVILTISGNVAKPTRGASSEYIDKFFIFNEVEFNSAAQFDFAMLQALPQVKINTDFPKGDAVWDFEGPLLEDVLNAVGATGDTITIRALDGYAAMIPTEEAFAAGAVLALRRQGVPFAIGDFGPTHVVFPRADRADLADMNDDWWVWSVFHIIVE